VCAAIVGRLGTAPLGAVGLSTLVFNFSNFLFSFLMTVTTPRVAVAAANGNRTEVCSRWHRVALLTCK
jgi:Na+-driven multidrug efflux pump